MSKLFLGLMSGTSLDGVDAVLADFLPASGLFVAVLAHAHSRLAPDLRAELLALNTPGANELHRAALAANAISHVYAQAASAALQASGFTAEAVQALGAPGQTVCHCPGDFDKAGYTVQLLNPALLAELTGVDVVADFRSRDVAAGGQGAPLVPAFHRAVFARPGETVAVLNIGGISNLTVLEASAVVGGHDCGPGNVLMDHWCQQHTGQPYDDSGAWAATGRVIEPLVCAMLAHPYFSAPGPKSTGRDLFNPSWLASHLSQFCGEQAQDVQASLAELTARVCTLDVQRCAHAARELLVCGGGALNEHLMQRLASLLPGVTVKPTDSRGLPAQQVEAAAFAWLARAFMEREPGNLPAVTGAAGERVLGALYPAR